MLENIKNRSSNKYKDYGKALKHLTLPHIKYMNPQISKENAKKIITNYMKEHVKFYEEERVKNTIKKLKLDGKI